MAGHLKFDVNRSYKEGFYLLLGPRISFISNATDEFNEDVSDFYAKTRIAVQLGLGIHFLKHFGFELVGDYGVSDILNSEDLEGTTAGGYALFTVNLESILNK